MTWKNQKGSCITRLAAGLRQTKGWDVLSDRDSERLSLVVALPIGLLVRPIASLIYPTSFSIIRTSRLSIGTLFCAMSQTISASRPKYS
jgi:hypothetical protein